MCAVFLFPFFVRPDGAERQCYYQSSSCIHAADVGAVAYLTQGDSASCEVDDGRTRCRYLSILARVLPSALHSGYCISSNLGGVSPMAEVGQAISRRTRDNYACQWNRFVAWSEASGRRSLPASAEDVSAYLEDWSVTGARPSTLRVAVSAIARNHRDAGFDAPVQLGAAEPSLDEMLRDSNPVPARALPLNLDCYLAIRKTARESRRGRGGRPELAPTARTRGAMDVAMIGLMRDGRLRVSEAADLTWRDVQKLPGGSGRVRVVADGETTYREVSADTVKLLSPVRRGAEDGDSVLCMRPNQIAKRIGAAARHAGLGEGYSGDSPRLGMIHDMETLGVHLLAAYAAQSAR